MGCEVGQGFLFGPARPAEVYGAIRAGVRPPPSSHRGSVQRHSVITEWAAMSMGVGSRPCPRARQDHQNQDFGNALRYPDDLNPGGWDAEERLAVMDAEGIDIAVLYCGLGQALGGFTDVDLAVACAPGLERLDRGLDVGRSRAARSAPR